MSKAGDPLPSFHGSVTWRMKGGTSQKQRNQSVYSLCGRKCCEGALKSNVKSTDVGRWLMEKQMGLACDSRNQQSEALGVLGELG